MKKKRKDKLIQDVKRMASSAVAALSVIWALSANAFMIKPLCSIH